MKLSLRARGLLILFLEAGRVLPISEITSVVKEGRDAVRSALRELNDAGLIQTAKYQDSSGQWKTDVRLTDSWKTDVGFSGALSLYLAGKPLVTSVLAVTPNGVTANTSLREEFLGIEEEEFMPWPVFDEGTTATPKRGAADEETGVVGKIEDKRASRNEKYKRVKFDAVSPAALRAERPEEAWTTDDIVAEFYDQARKAAPGIASQVNGSQLAAWVNLQVGQGVPRIRVLRALRAFFEDPRNTHDAGRGQPLWRRFTAFFPSAQITVSESFNPEAEKELMEKMEAKALRDLGLG